MGDVVQFPREWSLGRSTAELEVSAKPSLAHPHRRHTRIDRSRTYECTRCRARSFELAQSGDVLCCECEAVMTNISIVDLAP